MKYPSKLKRKNPMTEEDFNLALLKIQRSNGTPEFKRRAKSRFFKQYYEQVYGRGKRGY